MYAFISPQDWNLQPATQEQSEKIIQQLCGMSLEVLELRCKRNIYEWLPQHFSDEDGAFRGYYNAQKQRFELPQLVNLIAPCLLMAGYDRYGDEHLLNKAIHAAEWLHCSSLVVTHPMSLGIGGVLQLESREAWTKYSAEYVMLNLGLYKRTNQGRGFLERAIQSGQFLIQAARHDYATKLHLQETWSETWSTSGWQAFGRAIEAFLSLYEVTGEANWRNHALAYGEYALDLQGQNGCFYLINGEYYNSDLAADPLRALVFLFEETGEERFLRAARRFADWHIQLQSEDGSWPINIDKDGNVLCSVVGPGDVSNIGIALLRVHKTTDDNRYLDAAIKAFQYSVSTQITPEGEHPFSKDPKVRWGFWSWMPYHDYTVSADQATHHIRGLMFLMDYVASLESASIIKWEIENDN